jgi:hypothetical protein
MTSYFSPIIETEAHAFQGTGKRKIPKQRAALGENAPPQSMRQALDRDNALEWAESMDSVMEGLTKMGVLLHDQTLADCREAGITSKPVPMGLYFDEKTDQTGNVVNLFLGVKSPNYKDKSGTGAVNAFKIYYTLFKIHTLKDQKSSTGQFESSFDVDMKNLISKSRWHLCVAIVSTKPTCQRTVCSDCCSDCIAPCSTCVSMM